MLPTMKLTPLVLPLLASVCAPPVSTPPPPVADVVAVTEAKPLPSVEAVTDAKAKARDDAAIEAWGERIQAAGVNLCLLLEDRFDVDYGCGGR
ncbi:hypothetical protein HME9302_00026 [Alteripontixanthobacter maritimus]|uniref:Uncharacterized protein n=1 Tax=Alteripontixanthobacter maritimus TaxID=2161824 RepID=A0A369QSE1_9SPHN|nr:hypothetical protein HME9302_01000 [Alteripontixanthobacter maritimus]RDC66575.1 hypothetical protein HME9302_00026 [Alteripontixanthobacter maritimus]